MLKLAEHLSEFLYNESEAMGFMRSTEPLSDVLEHLAEMCERANTERDVDVIYALYSSIITTDIDDPRSYKDDCEQ